MRSPCVRLLTATTAEATRRILHVRQSKTSKCDHLPTSQELGSLNSHEPNKSVGAG
jgi:hypothetical protein